MEKCFCTSCGAQNEVTSNFCFKCGQSIHKGSLETEAPPLATDPPKPRQPIEATPAYMPKPITAEPTIKENADKQDAPEVYGWFFSKHWNGGYSLGIAYWAIGIFAGLCIALLTSGLEFANEKLSLSAQENGALILAFYSLTLAIFVWHVVGLGRSASKHKDRGGKPFWANVVYGLIGLWTLRFCLTLFTDGVPLIKESFQMLAGNESIPPYSLRLLRDNTELEISGGLRHGVSDAVKDLLEQAPNVRVIHLNSIGGRISEASRLATLFRQRKLSTYTPSSCDSACALAFLGGHERFIGENGKIGFHSASINGSIGSAELDINSEFTAALTRVGALPDFILKATTTPPDDIWYPTHTELKRQGIISSVVESRKLGLSGFADWRDTSQIEEEILSNPALSALSKYNAAAFEKARDMIVDGIQNGRSLSEIQTSIHEQVIVPVVPFYLGLAPDQALVRYWKTQLAEMAFLAKTNPEQCMSFIGLKTDHLSADIAANFPEQLANDDIAALAEVIRLASTSPVKNRQGASIDSEMALVISSMNAEDARAVNVVISPEEYIDQAALTCNSFVLFYKTIMEQPQEAAAKILRSITSEASNPSS